MKQNKREGARNSMQLIKIGKARHLAGVTIFILSLHCQSYCKCNSYSTALSNG